MASVLEMRKPTAFIPYRELRRAILGKLEDELRARQLEAISKLPPPVKRLLPNCKRKWDFFYEKVRD